MQQSDVTTLTIALVSLLIILVYHGWLWIATRINPNRTVIGLTRAARRAWCRVVVEKKDGILTVQTLRNWLMTSSLLATASVTITIGLTAFVSNLSKSNNANLLSLDIYQWKFVILISFYAGAFFSFTQAMRYFTHIGFLITASAGMRETNEIRQQRRASAQSSQYNINGAESSQVVSQEIENEEERKDRQLLDAMLVEGHLDFDVICELLNRGAMFHTFGLRGFYLTFPLILHERRALEKKAGEAKTKEFPFDGPAYKKCGALIVPSSRD
ncbi:uncharacterized protein SPPG_07661 [Spizellomyces punctatus DAOM BR117]|uniref:Uncharacterized protein n=1 Tax=Spizellomyces punctatus (strain DAOM BR117) TaxID=645134 RepID=A0A0L0H6G6_SPIPD|nr:uncharacterized protein SPPG_07661 [Spizellomyces punctatus DAOM BR117]KNC96827.1 hypothetical protein SPPG_07661 [Spizellomyces punctatus DAOM BR117]|eukprot:XP_016604867.1 hypothetical protein SPPG_07661 [Spizellomyces punctatus DAOM BR117]